MTKADERAVPEATKGEGQTMTLPKTVAVYRQLVEAAPDAIIVVDSDGLITLANQHAEKLFGYARNELLGAPLEMLVPERFVEAHKRHRSGFFKTPSSRPMGSGIELSGRRRDGSEFPAEISLSSVEAGGGFVAAASIRDVSDRVQVNAALRAAEEKFRSTFHSAGIGMALAQLDGPEEGRLLDVNQSFCALTGYRREQLLEMDFASLGHPDSGEMQTRVIDDLLSEDTPSVAYECRWVDARGEQIWVQVTSSIVLTDAGQPHYCLHQVADLNERKHLEEQLRHLADHDSLTNLFNRRRFLVELERELAAARRYERQGAVLMLDLDHFKYVNDTLGHLAGDGLITRTAAVLLGHLRETDILARLGGDEFAVILPDTDLPGAEGVAAKLLAEVGDELHADGQHGGRPVTVSIGVAPFSLLAEGSAIDLLNQADIAMYDAKDDGGGRVALYEPARTRHLQMNARLNMAHTIRQALRNDGLMLEAQPIRSLNGDHVPRYELLLRLIDENGDVLRPNTFLPIAERFGLAREIDEQVTGRAIDLLHAHQQAGRDLALAVNLSAQSITDDSLLQLAAARLAEARIPPNHLCFELTETAAIVNVDNARMFADRLTEIGCEFALDDFGAGYASFYYLKHIHFDYIKIDGEFIRGFTVNETNRLIVEAVVQLANGLGRKTVAEFVEDEMTLRRLYGAGVDYAQGYHIGPPASLRALERDFARPAA